LFIREQDVEECDATEAKKNCLSPAHKNSPNKN